MTIKSVFAYNLSKFCALNLLQKCIVILSLIGLGVIFAWLFICDMGYFLSFFVGFFSFIILMIASIYSINKKVQQKILEAKQKADSIETTKDSSDNKKKILKFLDLSKISLGFELSFSLARILAFCLMILGFILLIIFNTFHALIYILGIFLASVITILFLFLF